MVGKYMRSFLVHIPQIDGYTAYRFDASTTWSGFDRFFYRPVTRPSASVRQAARILVEPRSGAQEPHQSERSRRVHLNQSHPALESI